MCNKWPILVLVTNRKKKERTEYEQIISFREGNYQETIQTYVQPELENTRIERWYWEQPMKDASFKFESMGSRVIYYSLFHRGSDKKAVYSASLNLILKYT